MDQVTSHRSLILSSALLILTAAHTWAQSPAAIDEPLWLYQGSWAMTLHPSPTGSQPVAITNDCAFAGRAFACEQTVNATTSGLVVFLPHGQPGHYITQGISPDGSPQGRGELEISGARWVYSSEDHSTSPTVYSRTTNVFTDHDHIQFEQSESSDGNAWTVLRAGEERRTTPTPSCRARASIPCNL